MTTIAYIIMRSLTTQAYNNNDKDKNKNKKNNNSIGARITIIT